MAQVDAVEIADGHRAAAKRIGQTVQGARDYHKTALTSQRQVADGKEITTEARRTRRREKKGTKDQDANDCIYRHDTDDRVSRTEYPVLRTQVLRLSFSASETRHPVPPLRVFVPLWSIPLRDLRASVVVPLPAPSGRAKPAPTSAEFRRGAGPPLQTVRPPRLRGASARGRASCGPAPPCLRDRPRPAPRRAILPGSSASRHSSARWLC